MNTIRMSLLTIGAALCFGCGTAQLPGGNNVNSTAPPNATRTPQPSTPATVNGKTISHEMTDEQILAALEIDIRKATSNVAKGPDGYSTSYKIGEQSVSITRSIVTGVYVYASGGPLRGEWRHGGGN